MAAPTTSQPLYVDFRMLQKPEYHIRGIGRHTASLLAHRPRGGPRLVALTDSHLPALVPAVRDLADEVLAHWTLGPRRQGAAWFLNPSPMTDSPILPDRLLQRTGEFVGAALVYDFIPLEFDGYMPVPWISRQYHACLASLQRYGRYFPLSRFTQERLQHYCRVGDDAVTVTGVGVADAFFQPPGDAFHEVLRGKGASRPAAREEGSYLLAVGEMDPRKNLECAVQGAAAFNAGRRHPAPLVVVGVQPGARRDALAALAAAQPTRQDVVFINRRLTDEELASLYGHALASIVASHHEGFSMPVVESAACGCPVVLSRIPAHEELLPEGPWWFSPDEPAALAAALTGCAGTPEARARTVEAQGRIAARFTQQAVAGVFWERMAQPPSVTTGQARPRARSRRTPRLALLAPHSPQRGPGPAFAAALARALAGRAELKLYSNCGHYPERPELAAFAPMSPDPFLDGRCDAAISILANDPAHEAAYSALTRFGGGACIMLSGRLLEFQRSRLTPEGRRPLAMAALAARLFDWRISPDDVQFWLDRPSAAPSSFMEEVTARAAPLVVHSADLMARLEQEAPHARCALLPFPIEPRVAERDLAPAARAAARRRLALRPGRLIIASFQDHPFESASGEALWTLEQLVDWGVDAELHFVGDFSGEANPLERLADRLGLAGRMRCWRGPVAPEVLNDYLLAADVGLQLSRYGFGQLSSGLGACAAAGLTTITNEDTASLGAPPFIHRVGDVLSPLLLAERMHEVLAEGGYRERVPRAVSGFLAAHTFDQYAHDLLRVLEW